MGLRCIAERHLLAITITSDTALVNNKRQNDCNVCYVYVFSMSIKKCNKCQNDDIVIKKPRQKRKENTKHSQIKSNKRIFHQIDTQEFE